MKLINLLPGHYIEHEFFRKIFKLLDEKLFKDVTLIVTHDYDTLPEYGQGVVVLLTAGDERGTLPSYHKKVRYVFKHHLDAPYLDNVWHLPLPYVNGFSGTPKIPITERTTDVLFAGRNSRREDMLAAVERLVNRRPDLNIICFDTGRKFMRGGWPIGTYSREMSNAKIILSPRGAVRAECIRFTEAVACGAAIIACKHPDLPCFEQTPATYLDSWNGLQEAVEALLVPGRLPVIQAAMKLAWERFFSPEAQAILINAVMRGDKNAPLTLFTGENNGA